ncbi:MAG: mammalian cell entry protein, partial [Hydrogenophaga sp.]|nr:mammalian cell entry protein [Hydrogenophaga sp.]
MNATPPPLPEPEAQPLLQPDQPPPVKNLEVKAALLLLLMLVLVVGSALYVLYARGAFERTQRLVLVSDDIEGVVVGMDMTFTGFAIGRVARVELGDDGNARILVDVPSKDARWLRTSSIFTMERSLVGSTRIRAYSGVLEDPPLEDGAERTVLRGDAAAEIPKLTASIRDLLDNLNALT